MDFKITSLFDKPKIISVIGDVNSAKSNLLYDIIINLRKIGEFKLYCYGLRNKIDGAQEIFSVEELEQIRDSVITLDEVMSLWDLDNRKAKRMIELSLRLIFHNNNILIIAGVPDNFRKFISGKTDVCIFKKVTISDFVNGSKVKNILLGYKGNELGSNILNLKAEEAVVFDGKHYNKINIPYHKKYDSKLGNVPIVAPKKDLNVGNKRESYIG